MMTNDKKYTIAVDFDGVIHSYTTPWISATEIPDLPVPGAIDWLNKISKDFKVVIHTTRGETLSGQAAVRDWLTKHGYELADTTEVEVTALKPAALVYIDDRAWRFEGTFPSRHEIHMARPWNKPKEKHDD
jgi:hypothetical protein